MVEFTEKEQEYIINKFLDIVLVNDIKQELKNKCDACKCKNYLNHNRYRDIGHINLPNIILNHIYKFSYKCIFCQGREEPIREIEYVQNHNVDFLNNANIKNWLFVIQCKFPDKSSFPKMSKQRYNLMKRIYVFRLQYYNGQSTTELNIKELFRKAGFSPVKNYQELYAITINIKHECKMKYSPDF